MISRRIYTTGIYWFNIENGSRHRFSGPYYNVSNDWCVNGSSHRLYGPYYIGKYWRVNDKNIDGFKKGLNI